MIDRFDENSFLSRLNRGAGYFADRAFRVVRGHKLKFTVIFEGMRGARGHSVVAANEDEAIGLIAAWRDYWDFQWNGDWRAKVTSNG